MKKNLLILAKIALAGFFLYNISFFSFIGSIDTNSKNPPFKEDSGREDFKYLNEKIKRAQNLGRDYSPELYFADLTEIRLKEKKNDFDRGVVLSVNSSIQKLLAIFSDNIKYSRGHLPDRDYKKLMSRLSKARDKHRETLEPGITKRNEEFKDRVNNPNFWPHLFMNFLIWLVNFYLKNFYLGFALLWLWWYQEKKTFRINNPLSFLICLFLYPLTIIKVWGKLIKEGSKTFALSIEFKRRQVDLFAIISDDELKDIKRFTKSNLKINDYRRYLDNRGLIVQQAFIPVIAATLLLLIIPQTSVSGADYPTTENCYHFENKAPPGLNCSHFNFDNDSHPTINAIIEFIHFIFQPLVVKRIILLLAPKQSPGYINNPDPVPLTY